MNLLFVKSFLKTLKKLTALVPFPLSNFCTRLGLISIPCISRLKNIFALFIHTSLLDSIVVSSRPPRTYSSAKISSFSDIIPSGFCGKMISPQLLFCNCMNLRKELVQDYSFFLVWHLQRTYSLAYRAVGFCISWQSRENHEESMKKEHNENWKLNGFFDFY